MAGEGDAGNRHAPGGHSVSTMLRPGRLRSAPFHCSTHGHSRGWLKAKSTRYNPPQPQPCPQRNLQRKRPWARDNTEVASSVRSQRQHAPPREAVYCLYCPALLLLFVSRGEEQRRSGSGSHRCHARKRSGCNEKCVATHVRESHICKCCSSSL